MKKKSVLFGVEKMERLNEKLLIFIKALSGRECRLIKMAWEGESSQPQPEAINRVNCITNVPILIQCLLSTTVILIWLPVAVRETDLGCLQNVLSVLTMTKLSCAHAVSCFFSDINYSTLETQRLKNKAVTWQNYISEIYLRF